jgi:beta-glucanase (GH16 family)
MAFRMKKILVIVFLFSASLSFAKKYKGAEVSTNEKFLYGRFEVKMKSTRGSGVINSFFTFYDDPDFVENWNEIDIEILGRYQNQVQYNGIIKNHEMHEYRQPLSFNPHKAFHVYSFDWTPDYIAWSVDGKEVYRDTAAYVKNMNKPQKLMMNLWISNAPGWAGTWADSILPIQSEYEFVKYYEFNSKKNEFKLKWTDEFDEWDGGRWSKASHTFEENLCDFAPENARVQNGVLVLSLTKSQLARSTPAEDFITNDKKGKIASAKIESETTIKIRFAGDTYKPQASKSNFKIEGLEVLKTKLYADLRTLDITVSGMEQGKEYKLIYTGPEQEKQEMVLRH